MTTVQNGAVSPWLGSGLEFTALAVVVVGGISLLGGRGSILIGIIPGAFIFEMIRNGLTNLGANPYSYRLVGGAVIFAAMYADALKSGRLVLKRGSKAWAKLNETADQHGGKNETLHCWCCLAFGLAGMASANAEPLKVGFSLDTKEIDAANGMGNVPEVRGRKSRQGGRL